MIRQALVNPFGQRSVVRRQGIVNSDAFRQALSITEGVTFYAPLTRGTAPLYSAAGTTGLAAESVDADGTFLSWDTGLVTQATVNVARISEDGMLSEVSSANRVYPARDFTDVRWSATDISVDATSSIMPDGTARTTNILTADDANGTLIQDLGAIASSAGTFAIWIKRKTGTGAVNLTRDGGAGWTEIAVTSAWTRVELTQTVEDPDVGIQIETSGDEVYVDFAQDEAQSGSTSAIPTTGAALTRSADSLRYPLGENVAYAAGTLGIVITPVMDIAGWPNLGTIVDIKSGNERLLIREDNSDAIEFLGTREDGGSDLLWQFSGTSSPSKGVSCRIIVTWKAGEQKLYVDGSEEGAGATSANVPGDWSGGNFFIGRNTTSAREDNSAHAQLIAYNYAMSAAQVTQLDADMARLMGITS
jgi:hypothetical protein